MVNNQWFLFGRILLKVFEKDEIKAMLSGKKDTRATHMQTNISQESIYERTMYGR